MRAHIEKDEWFPVYSISHPCDSEYWHNNQANHMEIPEELYERWKRAHDEFEAVQALLCALYEYEVKVPVEAKS